MGRLVGLRSDELCSTLDVGDFAVHQTEWGTLKQPPEGSTPDVHPHTTKLEREDVEEQSRAVPGDRRPRTATAADASPAIFEIASMTLDIGVALDAELSRVVEVLRPVSPPDRNATDALEWMQSADGAVSEFRPATGWRERAA